MPDKRPSGLEQSDPAVLGGHRSALSDEQREGGDEASAVSEFVGDDPLRARLDHAGGDAPGVQAHERGAARQAGDDDAPDRHAEEPEEKVVLAVDRADGDEQGDGDVEEAAGPDLVASGDMPRPAGAGSMA
jgi:hypothetical protein